MPSPTEPKPIATFAHAAPLDWTPCSSDLASTCLSISELILSTSPSATAPSYARPSSVCTAAAAATSSCARSSIKPSYIAIDRPDNELHCRLRGRRGSASLTGRCGGPARKRLRDRLSSRKRRYFYRSPSDADGCPGRRWHRGLRRQNEFHRSLSL